MLKKLTALVFTCAMSLFGYGWEGRDTTLYWQVNDSATVDGASMHYSFLVPYPEDDDNWNGIRVKVVSPDGQIQRILDFCDDNGGTYSWKEAAYVGDLLDEYDNPTGLWGSGVPTGNQSPLHDLSTLIAEEYYIQAELGRLSWNYDTDSADWSTLAYSAYEKLTDDFKTDHTYDLGTIAPPTTTSWIPEEFFTIKPAIPSGGSPYVPEPSTSLLGIIGLGLLLLKRKTHVES